MMSDEEIQEVYIEEGLWRPKYCPRGLNDCEPISYIVANGVESFSVVELVIQALGRYQQINFDCVLKVVKLMK